MGEAGAGKTELFLAKALASALDPEVIRIYYCIPSKKEEKKTKLHMLVDDFRNRHACDFVEKFQIISYETLVDETFHQRMPKDLSKVVLLIDEFLYRYDQIFQASPKQLHTMCLKLGPYLKHFWLASLTLKWYSGIDIINKMYVPHEFFSGKPLNVQYRSAKHIGQLCTHLVHLDRLGRFSSSRVPGVFISGAQQEVRLEAFQQNLLQLEKPEKLELDSKYSQNRWIVAVCFTKNKSAWMNYIKRQFAGNEANQDVFTISMEDGPPGCNFSRGEIQSVVLFVDGPSKEEYEAEKDKYDDLMLLVCSRAQYELSIFVRDDLDHIFGTFDRCFKGQKEVLEKPSSSKSSLMIAEFLNDLETMIFSEEDVKQRFDKKEHKILIQILTNRDAKAIRFIILNLGVKLARNIFAVLLDDSSTDYGEELHPGFIFKSAVTWALWVDSEDLLLWVFEVIDIYFKKMKDTNIDQEHRTLQLLEPHIGEILCYAAFKPNLIVECLTQLKNRSLLTNGFRSRVKFLDEEVGILPVLCYANVNIRETIIAEYLKEIPEEFLLDELLGRNALQHAIDHGNWKSEELLKSTEPLKNKFS